MSLNTWVSGSDAVNTQGETYSIQSKVGTF